MGSLCSSLFGSSQSTSYTPPAAVTNAVTDILNRAATQSNQPYPQYTPDMAAQYQNYNAGLLAPLTPNQAAAGQTIAGLQGYTNPNFAAANQLAVAGATPLQMQQFSPGAVNQYMNPYMNDVVNSAVANINQTNAQQQQQVLGNAIQQGAYGGDRAGIAQAELARQQNLANNATIANLLGQGYQSALGEFNTQQQTGLATQLQNNQLFQNAALNLANLGTQGQQAQLQQAQAQYGYGTAEQQQQQAGLSTAYQQYLNQQAFPYQQLSYYAGLASGAAPALGGTTTGYTPTVGPVYGTLGTLQTLGQLTNPATYGSGQALSGIGSLASGIGSAFSALPSIFNQGGRVERAAGGRAGYADGGTQTVSPVTLAYNDYQNAVKSGASMPVLQQLYAKYQQSLQGATPPWTTPSTGIVAVANTPATSTGAGGVSAAAAPYTGPVGDRSGSNASAPITAQNAAYSPDFTSSNGPVSSSGGYGPYNNGGGSGVSFNEGGILGGLGAALGSLFTGGGGQNKTPYDPNYTGVTSTMDGTSTSASTSAQPVDGNGNPVFIGANGQMFSLMPDGSIAPTPDDQGPSLGASKQAATNTDTSGLSEQQRQQEVSNSLPTGLLAATSMLESSNNPNAANGKSVGLYGFMPSTAASLGLTDRTDPDASTAAAGTGYAGIMNGLANAGITNPTAGQAYLGWQQGLTGATTLLNSDPNMSATAAYSQAGLNPKAITNNLLPGMTPDVTVGDFVSGWSDKANSLASKFGVQSQDSNVPTPTERPSDLGPPSRDVNATPYGPMDPQQRAEFAQQSGDNAQQGLGGLSAGPSQTANAALGQVNQNVQGDQSTNSQGASNQSLNAASPGTEGDGGGGDKRGGRIHAHRYASGGFTPITMQYGLPSQQELQEEAQSLAGTGVGALPITAEALASKGVLPSKKGGRIHAQTGVGISSSDDDSTNMWGEEPPPTPEQQQAQAAKQQADLDRAYASTRNTMRNLTVGPEEAAARAQRVIDQKSANEDAEYNRKAYAEDLAYRTANAPKTEPIIPATGRADGDQTGTGAPAQTAADASTWSVDANTQMPPDEQQQKQQPVRVAQAAPTTMNDATQEVAPGIKQWYNAPPPTDLRPTFGLAVGAGLLSGQSLAAAANDYAKNVMAQQQQERLTMQNQAQSAQERATGIETGVRTALERVQPMGLGYGVISGTGTGPVSITNLQNVEPGQTTTVGPAGQSVSGGTGTQMGGVSMRTPYAGEVYTPDYGTDPNAQQSAAVNLTKLAKQAAANAPLRPELASKNYETSQAMTIQAQNEAQAANRNMVPYKEVMDAIHMVPQGGPLSAGITGPARYKAISTLNDTARTFGIDLGLTDTMSAPEIMQKFATAAANQTSESRAAKWLETTAASLPQIGLNLPTMQKLAANQYTDAYEKRLYANAAKKLFNESNGQDTDMVSHFNAINPPETTAKIQNSIFQLMNAHQKDENQNWIKDPQTGKYETPISMYLNGRISPQQFDAIAYKITGMKNMSSVFGH